LNFRSTIEDVPYSFQIDYKSKVLFLGSCFAENVGLMMRERKFNGVVNPFGISYNPISISRVIQAIVSKQYINENDLIKSDESFVHLDYHSRLSAQSQSESVSRINTAMRETEVALQHSDYVFVSIGTSYVHILKSSNNVVSNCHKLPSNLFEQKQLTEVEIISAIELILNSINKLNSKARIIFTVSPIRHTRIGLINNSLSKARLISSVHHVIKDHTIGEYFPAFEIMQDDLRDYRFYASDLIHPNDSAIEYIWSIFSKNLIAESSIQLSNRVEKVKNGLQHKPIRSNKDKFKAHLISIKGKIQEIRKEESSIDFSKELSEIEDRLQSL